MVNSWYRESGSLTELQGATALNVLRSRFTIFVPGRERHYYGRVVSTCPTGPIAP